jgi:hypothetical protein
MVDRTPYRQQKTEQHQNTMTRKEGGNNGGQNTSSVHHYFPLLSWSSCFGVAQSFVVYMVFCPPLFPPSFLIIVFWCCPVFCCLYSVLSTIIFLFFPGHRVLVLPSLLLSIWCSVQENQNTMIRKEGGNNGGQNTI